MAINVEQPADQLVSHVCKQLAFDFGDEFTEEAIQRYVSESFEALSQARIQTYVPLLIHRTARARLRADASARKAAQVSAPESAQIDQEAVS